MDWADPLHLLSEDEMILGRPSAAWDMIGAAKGGNDMEPDAATVPFHAPPLVVIEEPAEPPSDPGISLFETDANGTEIGVNVAWFSGSNANDIVLFIDQLKGARPWDDPGNTGEMTYDENGYPTSVPSHYVVSQLLIRSGDVEGIDPHTGMFRLYGQGSGEISLVSSAQGNLVHRAETDAFGTEVIDGETFWYVDVDFSTGGEEIGQLKMLIHDLEEGNHIHGMALVHHTHLAAHRAGEIFAPELIDDLQGFETLRLMDWMRGNRIQEDGNGWGPEGSDWTSPDPEQRYVGTDYFTFNNHAGGQLNEGRFEVSVPIEHVVELANRVGADPWINLPVDITDARAAAMAEYVADHLDEGLTARWEYGNELFNHAIGFEGYRYAVAQAQATFENFEMEGAMAAVEWAAYRGPQIYEIIRDTMEADGDSARFVAPGWSFSGSLDSTGGLREGYLVRYFAAEQAQLMNDGTPLPLELVTDYSVAMYFGGTLADGRPDGAIAHHIVATVEGAEQQAQTLADWLLFGSDSDHFIDLTEDALTDTPTGIIWTPDLDIGVTELIWDDIQAGLDPLTDLPDILRLDGNALQYRALGTEIWRDVLIFEAAPEKSLAEMIADVDLVGYGSRLFGEVMTGLRSSVANSATWRLDAHVGYADALGLNFVAYEGGSHVSYPVNAEGAFEMYDAFNTGAAGAEVLARWLETMSAHGLDEYMHFMSHDRTNGNDWWGLQSHIGQDISGNPEALVIQAAIAAHDPTFQPDPIGPLAGAEAVRTTATGDLIVDMPVIWTASEGWTVNADGSATESAGLANQLRLADLLPVAGGSEYVFSMDIGLDGAEQTELRVVARALSGGSAELLRWQGMVTDGETLNLDLGMIPEHLSSLYLMVQRVGQDRSGTLMVLDADLTEIMQEQNELIETGPVPLQPANIFDDPRTGIVRATETDLFLMSGARTHIAATDVIAVEPGQHYTMNFTVTLNGMRDAELRLVARSQGDSTEEVLRWRDTVSNGERVTLELDHIPEGGAFLDLILLGPSFSHGRITISDLSLTETPLEEWGWSAQIGGAVGHEAWRGSSAHMTAPRSA